MAVKMYAIHKILKRAIGLNYDIYAEPGDDAEQTYAANKALSENAKRAVDETKNMSWKNKLHYYYTRVPGVAYYNNNMVYGSLIITYSHTHDWSSGQYCYYCGACAG